MIMKRKFGRNFFVVVLSLLGICAALFSWFFVMNISSLNNAGNAYAGNAADINVMYISHLNHDSEIISEPTAVSEINENECVPPKQLNSKYWLGFPLKYKNWTPYTADITSVFDHAMKTLDGKNHVVAYTGEGGSEKADGTCDKNGNGCGYKKGDGSSFNINDHYVGVSDNAKILQYDDHRGYDYPVIEEPVYAAADGCVHKAQWDKENGVENGGGYYIKIKHNTSDGFYYTSYLHLKKGLIRRICG